MTYLQPTAVIGQVTFLGLCADRRAGLATRPQPQLRLDWEGVQSDAHGGLTRAACVRVKRQYRRGTPIRNVRQLTVVSEADLAEIGARLDLPGPVSPAQLGANVMLSGVPHLSRLPSGARLIFGAPGGVDGQSPEALDAEGPSIAVDLENAPCNGPADLINAAHPGAGRAFVKSAAGLRGVTAWVERPGVLVLGARCRLHLPPPRNDPPEWTAARA